VGGAVRGGGALASTGPLRPRAGEAGDRAQDAGSSHAATPCARLTPEPGLPQPTTPATHGHRRSIVAAVIKTTGIDSRSEQPLCATCDERARLKEGHPSKVWAGGSYWRPNFLRGGCLEPSAAGTTHGPSSHEPRLRFIDCFAASSRNMTKAQPWAGSGGPGVSRDRRGAEHSKAGRLAAWCARSCGA
jgi:hypothetical protein